MARITALGAGFSAQGCSVEHVEVGQAVGTLDARLLSLLSDN